MPRYLPHVVIGLLVIALGLGAIWYAHLDDAPGLGMIGIALILGTIVYGVRTALRGRRSV